MNNKQIDEFDLFDKKNSREKFVNQLIKWVFSKLKIQSKKKLIF